MKKLFNLPAIRPGFWAVLAAITLALLLVSTDSWVRYVSIMATFDTSLGTPLPALSKESPTGFEGGMRRLILPPVGTDGCQWIMHTQKLLHDGGWRIRFTDQDNAPDGREVHWSHSFIWWLIAVGSVHSLFTGWPLPASVEAVSPYANTLLLVIFVLTTPWIVFRRLGVLPACAYALSLALVQLFFEFFMVGYPDHHGIVSAANMLCCLLLAVGGGGWISRSGTLTGLVAAASSERSARRYFIASGVTGAVALWVSAATAVPVLAGLGIAAVISFACLVRHGKDPCDGFFRDYSG